MEKLSRVSGLRMLAIKEGTECGKISHIVINPDLKTVCYYALDTGTGFFGLKLLPTQLATSMGADFATTQTNASLINFWEEPDALALAFTDTDLIGARVITNNGDVIGTIKDIEFCPKEGEINEYYMADGRVITKDNAVTMARGILFIGSAPEGEVTEAVETSPFEFTAVEEPAGEDPAANEPIAAQKPELEETVEIEADIEAELEIAMPEEAEEYIAEEAPVAEEPQAANDDAVEATTIIEEAIVYDEIEAEDEDEDEPLVEEPAVSEEPEMIEPLEETAPEPKPAALNAAQRLAAAKAALEQQANPAPAKEPDSAADTASYFEKRRTEFLIGRVVKSDILNDDGTILVEKDVIVTAEIIDAVREANRLIDLTMNVN